MTEHLSQLSLAEQTQVLRDQLQQYQDHVGFQGPHSKRGLFYRRMVREYEPQVQASYEALARRQLDQLQAHPVYGPQIAERLAAEPEISLAEYLLDIVEMARTYETQMPPVDAVEAATLDLFNIVYVLDEITVPATPTTPAPTELAPPVIEVETPPVKPEHLPLVSAELLAAIATEQIEPYELSILQLASLPRQKIRRALIQKRLLPLPRLAHVEVEWLEFNYDMLAELAQLDQVGDTTGRIAMLRIIATFDRWQQLQGFTVRRDGKVVEAAIDSN